MTALNLNTAAKWMTLEQALDRISTRNKKKRIINDSLFIRISGSDPVYCWDSKNRNFVYVSKSDWLRASPAITTLEASKLLRVTPKYVRRKRDELGIQLKQGIPGKVDGVPRQAPQAYFSISDVMDIADILVGGGMNMNPASELEIRKLFARGYTTYKKLGNGEFVAVWDETI